MLVDPSVTIAFLVILVCLPALSWFSGSDAPFVTSQAKSLNKILKKAGVGSGKNFYDLGSGDGRVVIASARLGAKSFGVEQSYLRVLLSRLKAIKLDNAHFYHGNIFDRQYFTADIVYLYLRPKVVARLESKLKQELKKSAVVISKDYPFPSWKPFLRLDNFWYYRA